MSKLWNDFVWNTKRLKNEPDAINHSLQLVFDEIERGGHRLTQEQMETARWTSRDPSAHIAGTAVGCGVLWGLKARKVFQGRPPLLAFVFVLPLFYVPFAFTRNYRNFQFLTTVMSDPQSTFSHRVRDRYKKYAPEGSTTADEILEAGRVKREEERAKARQANMK
eukprot:GDKI01048385.1.p1 GENE.GDKI01048385.1~~GDKI01048385.1.p1  ORF type:complete len:165 (-),score=20.20 GDKI01048385.1:210-704(-)